MNNAIHQANLTIMKRSTQSNDYTSNDSLNHSPHEMNDQQKELPLKFSQNSYYQEEEPEIIQPTPSEQKEEAFSYALTQEEINYVLDLFKD